MGQTSPETDLVSMCCQTDVTDWTSTAVDRQGSSAPYTSAEGAVAVAGVGAEAEAVPEASMRRCSLLQIRIRKPKVVQSSRCSRTPWASDLQQSPPRAHVATIDGKNCQNVWIQGRQTPQQETTLTEAPGAYMHTTRN